MVARFVLALLIALGVFIGLQLTGTLQLLQNQYRVWSLKRLDDDDVAALQWNRQYLHSQNPAIRAAAAGSFGKIGQADEAVVTELISILDTDVPQVAGSAAWSLGYISISEPVSDKFACQSQILDALIRGLSHKNGRVRTYAAHSLSSFGTRQIDATKAIPALVACLNDPGMGYMAARALGDMGATDTADEIAALLEGASVAYQVEGAVALSKLQPLPDEIQAQLDGLMESNTEVRKAVEYSQMIHRQPGK